MRSENDDELEQLRQANPVASGSVPSADSPRARALFEELTMSDDAAFTKRRSAVRPDRRWVLGIAAAIVLIGSGAAAVALNGGPDGGTNLDTAARPDDSPEDAPSLSEPARCASISDLVVGSDRVVIGEVTQISPADVQGEAAVFRPNRIELRISEALKGDSAESLTFYGDGSVPSGGPPTQTGTVWNEVGDFGMYFLWSVPAESLGEVLMQLNPQGRFLKVDDVVEPGHPGGDPLSQKQAGRQWAEFREEVIESVRDTAGQPRSPGYYCGLQQSGDDETAPTGAADRAAQSTLRNAFTAARTISTDYQGKFQKNAAGDPIDGPALQAENPDSDLTYGPPGSAGVDIVSVMVSSLDGPNSHIWLITQSSAGTFHCLGGTSVGQVSRSTGESEQAAKATCVDGAQEW